MEQIVITKPDSSTWNLFSKGNVTAVTRAEQKRTLMGEDIVTMTVESAVKLDFAIRDQITIFGSKYFLNSLPKMPKNGKRKFTYELTWEGRQYDLLKPLYLDLGVDGISISPDFSLTGDLEFFMNVLVNCANRVFGTGKWALGLCPETDTRTFTFSNEKCLAVLQRLCKEENYNKEFEITEADGVCTINIKNTIGSTLNTVYEYGKSKGLYNLTRETVSQKDIITRLYVFGANKNLASDYRGFSQRLKIPSVDLSYIEDSAAINLYGIIEDVKIFDNIYPHRTGTITSLGSSVLEFIDSAMDFDLNAVDGSGNTLYLIPGTTAKIHFNTGNLAGYEFQVSSYDHSTKKFTLQAFSDERGQPFPDENSSAFQFGTSDEYVILDIRLPQSYIDTAEAELLAAGTAYFNIVKQPRVQYSQTFDELYFKQLYAGQPTQNAFSIGDSVNIKDADIGVDKAIRLKSFRRDVLRPYRYNLDLYDYNEEALVNKLVTSSYETQRILSANNIDQSGSGAYDAQVAALLNHLVIMNAGTSDAYLLAKLPLASTGNIQARTNAGNFPSTIWAGMPTASATVKGGIKIGSGLSIADGVLSVAGGVGTWGQITGTITNQTDLVNYVAARIAAMVDSAPATLDTLNEFAAALGDDPNFATTVTNLIATKAPINNPTFTGTVQGITKAMVGLGNVDNESKATMFNNPAFTGHMYNGGVYRKTITLPVPGPNVGQGKWFIRLHPSNVGRVVSVKVTVQGDWNYANISGWLTAESNYYAPGNGTLSQSDFRITSTCGNAHDLLRIGAPVSEGGYISIPVWCINTNAVIATVEWYGTDDQVHSSDWISESMPARNEQSVRGYLNVDGLRIGNYTFELSGSDLVLKEGSAVRGKINTGTGPIDFAQNVRGRVTL